MRRPPDVDAVSLRSDEVTLELAVDTCNAELEASAVESATGVQLTVLARNDTNDDCLDSVFISLEEPLGERRVVDSSSGKVFDVRVAED